MFSNRDYQLVDIPNNSMAYFDPPYKGTTKYNGGFDHERLYTWLRKRSISHPQQLILVSEYSMPEDFACIKEFDLGCKLDKKGNSVTKTEKLFIHRSMIAELNRRIVNNGD